MDLNEEQKSAISGWVQEGQGLSEIQKALAEQFDISMTYMDVRFLLLDLGLDVHDKPEAKPKQEAEDEPGVSDATLGGVSLEIDRIMKPGALVSGTVVFSDGKSGSWGLDQGGRLALDMGDPDYKPTEDDIAAFQQKLKATLEKRGF
jgi:hypothetical protein